MGEVTRDELRLYAENITMVKNVTVKVCDRIKLLNVAPKPQLVKIGHWGGS